MDSFERNDLIKRFRNIIYAPDIPALYGQGLSAYEILVRVAKVINDNADTMKSWYDIVLKLNDVLNDIDSAIADEVVKVVKEMYDSGEFDEIFKQFIQEYIDGRPNNSTLMFKRLLRNNLAIGGNNVYYGTTSNWNNIRYSKLGSGTYIERYKGNPYYVLCLTPDGIISGNRGHNNQAVIRLINASDFSVAGQVNVPFDHCNACDYNPNDECLYVAGCLQYANINDTDKQTSSMLYRINLEHIIYHDQNVTDTLQVHDAHDYERFDLSLLSTPIYSSNHVSYANDLPANHIYCGTGTCDIYELELIDENHYSIVERLTSQELVNAFEHLYENGKNFGRQTASVCGDFVYLTTYNPHSIVRGNLVTSQIDYIYNVPLIADNGYFMVGECENVKVLPNGDLYLFSDYEIFAGNYRQYRQSQVFKANIYHNELNNIVAFQSMKRDPIVLYVNSAAGSHNPTGTSTNQFTSIAEAVNFCNNNNVGDAFTIRMQTNSNMFIQISTSKKVRIETATEAQGADTDRLRLIDDTDLGIHVYKAVVGGIVATGGNVRLDNIQVNMSLPEERVPAHAYIYAYDSTFTANNVIIVPQDAYSGTVKTAYSFTSSFGSISGSSSSNYFTVDKTKATGGARAWLNNIDGAIYIGGSNQLVNSHGWAVLSGGVLG